MKSILVSLYWVHHNDQRACLIYEYNHAGGKNTPHSTSDTAPHATLHVVHHLAYLEVRGLCVFPADHKCAAVQYMNGSADAKRSAI